MRQAEHFLKLIESNDMMLVKASMQLTQKYHNADLESAHLVYTK